jgi:hypothetical protein
MGAPGLVGILRGYPKQGILMQQGCKSMNNGKSRSDLGSGTVPGKLPDLTGLCKVKEGEDYSVKRNRNDSPRIQTR